MEDWRSSAPKHSKSVLVLLCNNTDFGWIHHLAVHSTDRQSLHEMGEKPLLLLARNQASMKGSSSLNLYAPIHLGAGGL